MYFSAVEKRDHILQAPKKTKCLLHKKDPPAEQHGEIVFLIEVTDDTRRESRGLAPNATVGAWTRARHRFHPKQIDDSIHYMENSSLCSRVYRLREMTFRANLTSLM